MSKSNTLANNEGPLGVEAPGPTAGGPNRFVRRVSAVLGLAMVGCIANAAAEAPRGNSTGLKELATRVAALEAARVVEHKRRDFVIWQNRSAIRRLIDATASPGKPSGLPNPGAPAFPSVTVDRACCLPPTSFLVCDDLRPVECERRGGTVAPGQSASTALTCGVGMCGIKGSDQSAPGAGELFGPPGFRSPTPNRR